jgi:integrase/recombinase XerD
VLAERTEKDYRRFVRRWEQAGSPDPVAWVASQSSPATRRNARAALVWYHRVELGKTVDIPHVPPVRRVPKALSDDELARLRAMALGVHPRCRPVLDLLYTTGARLQELCGVLLEDVTETHIVLRETKRRPGGLRVERAVPLSEVSRWACKELVALGPGRNNNLIGAHRHTVQSWMVELQNRTGIRVYSHKLRATFATHLLARGVDVRTVQELMGHADLATTMKYLAVTEERLRALQLGGRKRT